MEAETNYTPVFEQVENGYIAYIEELPGVNSQGNTLEEARVNLSEALDLFLKVQEDNAKKEEASKKVNKKTNPRPASSYPTEEEYLAGIKKLEKVHIPGYKPIL